MTHFERAGYWRVMGNRRRTLVLPLVALASRLAGCQDVSLHLASRPLEDGGTAVDGLAPIPAVDGGPTPDATGAAGFGGNAATGVGGAGGSAPSQRTCSDPLTFDDPDLENLIGPIRLSSVPNVTQANLLSAVVPDPLGLDYNAPPVADGWVTGLGGIECLTSLQSVAMDPFWVDFGPLANLPHLTDLWFGPTYETSFPLLAGVTNLNYVVAANNNTAAILRALPSLTAIGGSSGKFTVGAGFDRGYLDFGAADARAALSNLANLKDLELTNQSDISFVSGLTRLTTLALGYNVQDISPLAGLTRLTSLDLGNNQIQDLSALSNLTVLARLILDGNPITDLSPLVANSGIGQGDDVSVASTPYLDCASQKNNIAALRQRGVNLTTDCP
jgi:hypothetical protein